VTHTISINGCIVILEVRHNGFEWTAIDDATYEPGCPVGLGVTAQQAINDWLRQQLVRVAA
jgi:hypothetical protein